MAKTIAFKTAEIRHTLCSVIADLKNNRIDVARATAIALVAKEMTSNISAEVTASKWAAKAQETGHDFGRVNRLGQMIVGELADDPEEGEQ